MKATHYILGVLVEALDDGLDTDSQRELLRAITSGYDERIEELSSYQLADNEPTIKALQHRVDELDSQLNSASVVIQALRAYDPNAVQIRVADSETNGTQVRFIAKDKFEQIILELERGCLIQAIEILRAEVSLVPGASLSLWNAKKTVQETEPRFAEAYNKGMALRAEHERRSKQVH